MGRGGDREDGAVASTAVIDAAGVVNILHEVDVTRRRNEARSWAGGRLQSDCSWRLQLTSSAGRSHVDQRSVGDVRKIALEGYLSADTEQSYFTSCEYSQISVNRSPHRLDGVLIDSLVESAGGFTLN